MKCKATLRCDKRPVRRGMCTQHYLHWLKVNEIGMVDAAPVREHIIELHKHINYGLIARLAGVDISVPQKLATRQQEKMRSDIARRLMAVTPPEVLHKVAVNGDMVPAVGTVRRLRALQALGYSSGFLAEQLPSSMQHTTRIIHGHQEYVYARTAQNAEALFNRLQMHIPQGPGVLRARLRAERNAWPLPMAWDEDTIDDPDAKPFGYRRRALTLEERLEEAYEMHSWGLTLEQIAARMNLRADTIENYFHRTKYLERRVS